MARLIGEVPDNKAEKYIYDFLMDALPDYIYAGFNVKIPSGSLVVRELDFLLIVPHLGIFIIEVKAFRELGFENGEFFVMDRTGNRNYLKMHNLKGYRYLVKDIIKKDFGVSPYVSEMLCLPFVERSSLDEETLRKFTQSEYIFFAEDFDDGNSFMKKLLKGKQFNDEMMGYIREKTDNLSDDLSDEMAYRLFNYWDDFRPARDQTRQVVYVCYDEADRSYAEDIKKDLYYRGFRTVSDPKDLPCARNFLLLLSSKSQENPGIVSLFEKAQKDNKRIFPLQIEEFKLNDFFQTGLSHCQYRKMIWPDYQIMNEIESYLKNGTENSDRG